MPRSLVLDGPRRLRLAEQPSRPLEPGEIRLRARLSGISHGTELSLYRGTSAFTDKVFDRGLRAFVTPHAGSAAGYPVTLGYEMVGEVTEVAPDVTEVKVGDLVHTGTPHQEETVLDVAASLNATYPLVRLPTAERPERALFISLAAVALQAVHDAEMKLGDAVSVHGLGTIGLLTVQMCRLEGIQNVFALDPDPARRKLAADLGASHVLDPSEEPTVGLQIRELNHGHGVDVAIEVSGNDRGLQGALEAAGLGATVVAAGFYQGGAANLLVILQVEHHPAHVGAMLKLRRNHLQRHRIPDFAREVYRPVRTCREVGLDDRNAIGREQRFRPMFAQRGGAREIEPDRIVSRS